MGVLSWLANTATSATLDVVLAKVLENYDKFSKTEVGKKTIESLTTGQARDKVWAFIIKMSNSSDSKEAAAADKLIDRQEKRQNAIPPYRHGDEETYMRILAYLYASFASDVEGLKTLLIILGGMDEEKFNTVIRGFDNDKVRQYALRIWSEAVATYQRFDAAGKRHRDQLLESWNYRI
jgi:hypothetical protein